MVFSFLKWLESQVTKEDFTVIVRATEEDIKFNRVRFNKLTTPIEFIEIALRCYRIVTMKYEEANQWKQIISTI